VISFCIKQQIVRNETKIVDMSKNDLPTLIA